MGNQKSMQQEQFSIDQGDAPRKKIVRQDRFPVTPKKFSLLVEGNSWEILNVSTFGLAIICKEDDLKSLHGFFAEDELREASIVSSIAEVQTVRLRIARIEKHPQSVFNDYVVGFEALGDAIAVDCFKAIEKADEIIGASQTMVELANTIPAEFRLAVYEIKEFLTFLKAKVDELEKLAPQDNANENSEFRETVALSFSAYLNKAMPVVYQRIPAMLAGLDKEKQDVCSQFIRTQLGTLVFGAPFARRAFYKPRGYAGDYEMMNHLYRDEVVGESFYDQCMHRYFIDEPAAQAVKNRGHYLLEQIRKTVRETSKAEIKILAVASGPAMEQQLFLKDSQEFAGKKIKFVCIDQDEESLKHAQREILSLERFVQSGFKFSFQNLAIKNILGRGLPEGEFDLIYTAGLFDYFTDPVAQMAAAKLYEGLADDGRLIIGNFSTENPTQPLMEMILEWHLIYRSKEEMARLFAKTGTEVDVEQEKLGINLFAVIK